MPGACTRRGQAGAGEAAGLAGHAAAHSVPWLGQSLYSNKPVQSPADLVGTKMRAYKPDLHASPSCSLAAGHHPAVRAGQALATNTVNNFPTSSASGVESKLYEQIKHFYPVNAWLPRNATVVNKKAFDSLDKGLQDAVLKAAATAEKRGWESSERLDKEFPKELAAKGMTIAEPSDALKKEFARIGKVGDRGMGEGGRRGQGHRRRVQQALTCLIGIAGRIGTASLSIHFDPPGARHGSALPTLRPAHSARLPSMVAAFRDRHARHPGAPGDVHRHPGAGCLYAGYAIAATLFLVRPRR